MYGVDAGLPSIPVPSAITISRTGRFPKTRTMVVVPGLSPVSTFGVFNNNVQAIVRALTERYYYCKVGSEWLEPLTVRIHAYHAIQFELFRDRVVHTTLNGRTVTPLATMLEVVAAYKGAKQRLYENARVDLLRAAVSQQDSMLGMFAKYEKQKLDKAPRAINPRDPRYNLELARRLKFQECRIFKSIARVWSPRGVPVVIKGMTPLKAGAVMRAKWDCFRNPVAFGLDAVKFDMHVSVAALKYEHSFYLNMRPGDRLLRDMLRWQLRSKGKARVVDGIVKFSFEGRRCSGDINTSLGNCILMCALVWCLCWELGVEVELANNGDDCVVICEQEDLQCLMDRVEGFFEKRGFRLTVEEPVDEFERIVFCQSSPVKTALGWMMVRDPYSCFVKDPMCLVSVPTDKTYQKWMGAVGECGCASVPGVPVMHSWYRMFVRSGIKCGAKFRGHIFKNTGQMQRIMEVQSEITPEARVSFMTAFGLNPAEQVALENWFDASVLNSSILNSLWEGAARDVRYPLHPLMFDHPLEW